MYATLFFNQIYSMEIENAQGLACCLVKKLPAVSSTPHAYVLSSFVLKSIKLATSQSQTPNKCTRAPSTRSGHFGNVRTYTKRDECARTGNKLVQQPVNKTISAASAIHVHTEILLFIIQVNLHTSYNFIFFEGKMLAKGLTL